jgi:hypothetical protein
MTEDREYLRLLQAQFATASDALLDEVIATERRAGRLPPLRSVEAILAEEAEEPISYFRFGLGDVALMVAVASGLTAAGIAVLMWWIAYMGIHR